VFVFEPDIPDEIGYRRKFNNTSMSAGDMNFGDINIGMNVRSLLYFRKSIIFLVVLIIS